MTTTNQQNDSGKQTQDKPPAHNIHSRTRGKKSFQEILQTAGVDLQPKTLK